MAISFTTAASATPNSGVQLSYPLKLTLGHEGGLADSSSYTSGSYQNTYGSPLAFGVLVAIFAGDTTGDQYAIGPVLSATDTIVGLNIDANVYEGATGAAYQARDGYYPNPAILADGRLGTPNLQTANVLSKGSALVYTTDVTTKMGDPVRFYINDVSASVPGAFLGRFCISPVAGKTVLIQSGARWRSAADNNIAVLELNFPTATYIAD
jgi:hypothetical protein